MTESAVAIRQTEPQLTAFEVIERVITSGDLSKMSAPDRVAFYWRTCNSLGLNPLTRPFEFISLNNKLTLYARKDATDQLRKLNAVSVIQVRREKDDELGLLTVYARGRDKSGREDEATGVVSIKGLGGEALANAVMKAETKAKRRLTLSLVGLGFLDESEIEGMGGVVDVDPTTGEIVERPQPKTLLESVKAQQAAMTVTPDEPTASDGPGASGDAEAPTDTTPEPVAAADPAPLDVGPESGRTHGLSADELTAALDDLGVSLDYAREFAKANGIGTVKDDRVGLTAAQRLALVNGLRAEDVAQTTAEL